MGLLSEAVYEYALERLKGDPGFKGSWHQFRVRVFYEILGPPPGDHLRHLET